MTTTLAAARTPGKFLPLLLCVLLGWIQPGVAAPSTQQQALDQMPQLWARYASSGNVDDLMSLYSPEAYIHVVFTEVELHGHDEIFAYYDKYAAKPATVKITNVEESRILGGIGILSGNATVKFPDQELMHTHFSIVCRWEKDKWVVQLQHISKVTE